MEYSFPRRLAGLIYGREEHYIDHLGPLCALLEIPLVVTEEDLAIQIQNFYPNIQVFYFSSLTLPEKIISLVDTLIVCTPKVLVEEVFFLAQKLSQKNIQTVWCPHGNSDKGRLCFHMEALDKEEIALVYGQKMIDFLKDKHVFSQIKEVIKVSNYRLKYYLENKKFYDLLIRNKIPLGTKTVLYAPTWKDAEDSSSFYEATEYLVNNLPSDWKLVIKPHPNLARQDEIRYDCLVHKYLVNPRVVFLKDFPPIYPLLSVVDIYIGDFSSIGYDFLYFNKPMFFLNKTDRDAFTDLGLYLYRCGVEIKKKDFSRVYDIIQRFLIEEPYDFCKIREQLYNYTFEEYVSLDTLREEIFSCCTRNYAKKIRSYCNRT